MIHVRLAITLPRELMARVAKWATENQLGGAPEALVQLIERGLLAPTESPRRNRGHPVHWGDGRYILLEGLVFQIKRELEHKNGPGKPRVLDKQAIKALRKRYPDKWGVYPEKTLVARFYDARRRLYEICVAYDHDAATADWGDSRYMLLEDLSFRLSASSNARMGRVSPRLDEQAIKALRKRYPVKWGVYPEETLVAHFYDAQRRFARKLHRR